ncbi:hypothetical protein MNV49_002522 [Pseudohyphozyma bogoriensis]|nr:hypothetical protein MNV49_002522 [Pseudohyphozyma bogoriensis]
MKDEEINKESPAASIDGEVVEWTEAAEKALIRKIDWRLIPFVSLLYLLSFLDRVNIGQAKLDNLEKDLGLVGNQYNIALVVFFVGYVVTEVPSNIVLKWLRPSRWIPLLLLLWSITMTFMGFVTNFQTLVVARFFLGITESGLFPGIGFFLTMWYKRRESNFRISIFFSAATLSGAFGGLLAYGLSQMDGLGGKAGWAWIFIIEGLITFVVACIAPFVMEDFPEQSKYLTPEEQKFVVQRLKADQGASGEAPFAWSHVWAAVCDWRVYVLMLIYIGVAVPFYSLSLFTPTIISELGHWTRAQSNLLSTPPFFLGFFVTIGSALYSDRIGNRGYFNVFWMTIVVIGYAILLGVNPKEYPGVAYFALFLCVAGASPCISNTITWCGNNLGPVYKRAVGMGMMYSAGNSGGIVSSLVYIKTDAPTFKRGHGVGLAFALMSVVLSLFLTLYYQRVNATRDDKFGPAPTDLGHTLSPEKQAERNKLYGLEGMSEDEIIALGDRHPSFRYMP